MHYKTLPCSNPFCCNLSFTVPQNAFLNMTVVKCISIEIMKLFCGISIGLIFGEKCYTLYYMCYDFG